MNPTTLHTAEIEALEARLGLRIAARLSELDVPADVSERLRFARTQALARRRVAWTETPPVRLSTGGAAVLGLGGAAPHRGGLPRWAAALGGLLPLLALLVGLALIEDWHMERQIRMAAEMDATLLTDDLPPTAYADPGFLEFLKTPRE
ncbi:DUF3619 family protein [Caldimonas manganoxidans]|jgi:hypothetical protein|uniref:DUF3619 family protein n=1 Tax=Caldimonas manganoxidans TaxID=196015 RepID=UPI000378751D|nr:DUF3619 family protein [Caldimonas manganoxidans]